MIKVFVGEFWCPYESQPDGGFSFEASDEQDLSARLDSLKDRYSRILRDAFREDGPDERCYKAIECWDDCLHCDY